MEEYIYIEILIEDQSSGILVDKIMSKYVEDKENIIYRVHSFKGMGKIPLNAENISRVKTKRLLTDLPMYLKGMDLSMKNMPGKKAIFVIMDSDDTNCENLKNKLIELYQKLNLSVQVFFCIAIEETEAWLLGDRKALLNAYPSAKCQLLQKYIQDSVIGTWEYLADIVYDGGYQVLKRNSSSYYEIGKFKCECAKKVGYFMDIRENVSPSFNYFIKKLDILCENNV